MARPGKNTVDYFPLYCKEGKSMYYIENKYGNDGFAVWVKILWQMARTNFHFLNMSTDEEMMFLAAKCKINEQKLFEIINDLVRLKELDEDLWVNHKVVASSKFLDSIAEAYKKRNTKPPSLLNLRSHLQGLGIVTTPDNSVSLSDNAERREDYIIEKKTIEDYLRVAKIKFENLKNDNGWIEVCCMQLKTTDEDLIAALAYFFSTLPPTSYDHNEKQLKQHFYNWYAKYKTNWRNYGKKSNVSEQHTEYDELSGLAERVLQSLTGVINQNGSN